MLPHDLKRLAPAVSLLAVVAALCAGSTAHAAACPGSTTTTYKGPVDGTWNAAGNWTANALPTTADVVCIPTGKGTIDIPAGFTANASLVSAQSPIRIRGGATLNIADVNVGHVSTFNGIALDGVIAGATSLVRLESGTLSGTGTVNHPFQDSGGTVAPGGQGVVGNLHFNQQFSLSAGTLALDLASDSSFDKLIVGPNDEYFGDKIAVNVLGSYAPTVGTNWIIMSGAAGSDTGFATVTPSQFTKVNIPGGLELQLSSPLPKPPPPSSPPPPTTPPASSPTSDPQPATTSGPPPTTAATSTALPAIDQDIHPVLLGCTSRKLVLNDVVMSGGRVVLDGAAAASLAGQTVKILFNGKRQVATATIEPNGAFHTTAPLPAKRLRTLNSTRYTAVAGTERSLDLKLARRVVLQAPQASGQTVSLTGQILPPLAAPVASVTVTQQVACGATSVVKTFVPGPGGRFHITVDAPAGAAAAIYRLQTKVRKTAHGKKASATFSLPLPAALG